MSTPPMRTTPSGTSAPMRRANRSGSTSRPGNGPTGGRRRPGRSRRSPRTATTRPPPRAARPSRRRRAEPVPADGRRQAPPRRIDHIDPDGGTVTTRPNIVVIQADQMAAQALGAYGDTAARTPHMDALAAEAAVFDRAYCNTPLCAPSRASMMTGRMPSDIDCFDNGSDFAASIPTFAHHLRAAGYHTALVGRMHFIGPDQHHGFEQRLTTDVYPADMDMVPAWQRPLDEKLQWYHEADPVFTAGAATANVQQDFDDEVIFKTLRHLNDRKRANQAAGTDQPFLMVTSFIHPHDPYEPPKANWDRFAEEAIPDPAHPEVPDAAVDPHSHRLRTMCGF